MIGREVLSDRVAALYRTDRRGRLVSINEWCGGAPPRFFLMRTLSSPIARYRRDVPARRVSELERLVASEAPDQPLPDRPAQEAAYLELLQADSPVGMVWAGPAFVFDREPDRAPDCVALGAANAELLRGGLEAWLADIPHRRPFLAAVEAGRAVAVCASVRISKSVHCAGVETLPAWRGRGFASAVTAAWAREVRRLGATPFYSTSWDNAASLGVAWRLGLSLAGVDFHVA